MVTGIRRRYRHDGVSVVNLRIVLPAETGDFIGEYLRLLSENYLEYVENVLVPQAIAGYIASEDAKKRFRYPAYSAKLVCDVLPREGGLVCVVITSELVFDDRRDKKVFCELYDPVGGVLLDKKCKL